MLRLPFLLFAIFCAPVLITAHAAAPARDTLRYSRSLPEIFGVTANAGEAEYRAAYRALLMQYHPDRNPGDKVAEEISKRLTSLMAELKKARFRPEAVKVEAPLRPKPASPPPPRTPPPPPPPPPKRENPRRADPPPQGSAHGRAEAGAGSGSGYAGNGAGKRGGGNGKGSGDAEAEAAARAYAKTAAGAMRANVDYAGNIKEWLNWESFNSSQGGRTGYSYELIHLEIPLSALETDFARDIPDGLRDSLLVKDAQGKPVAFRWILHPDDTEFGHELRAELRARKVPVTEGRRFAGRQTASKSVVVTDQKTGIQFSAEVSTNKAGGRWPYKRQTYEDTKRIRAQDRHLQAGASARHFTVFRDVASASSTIVNQGMVVRSLDNFAEGKRYVPTFAILDDNVGRDLARQNGGAVAAAYWKENLVKPLARAMAELSANYGETYDSSHAQQFLVELDAAGRPTGRIGLRDVSDVFLQEEFFRGRGKEEFLKNWKADQITRGKMDVVFGLLHGNQRPRWLTEAELEDWSREFFGEFEKEFSRQTGIRTTELSSARIKKEWDVYVKEYPNRGPAWEKHYARAPARGFGASCAGWFQRLFE